jgi:hypothetical protein
MEDIKNPLGRLPEGIFILIGIMGDYFLAQGQG